MRRWALAGALTAGLGACGAGSDSPDAGLATRADTRFVYSGIETRLLDDDLVNFIVEMEGIEDAVPLRLYAECAAAQYALIRDYAYLRHVRTTVSETAGIWRADAVYTISPDLPAGQQTIDAAFTLALCDRDGVPTV